ncbi:hypothetical protein AWM75_03750 [Aerococcus urinaehominis]|uniref:Uncharacterized protein n=1 Tax=Aerococcus urinaehominis TaxID=128944 RepID=A0A0X8FM51_9LACT|nr:hypothetical protein [Aerococcus urinaehominis]AMB99172.1 hypothetical protein AWM75_03750 [Aerococcus urinaehominis]SDM06220.1 hypothetical protein SAMN04487985_104108 [Aerococcus urinaehominis]
MFDKNQADQLDQLLSQIKQADPQTKAKILAALENSQPSQNQPADQVHQLILDISNQQASISQLLTYLRTNLASENDRTQSGLALVQAFKDLPLLDSHQEQVLFDQLVKLSQGRLAHSQIERPIFNWAYHRLAQIKEDQDLYPSLLKFFIENFQDPIYLEAKFQGLYQRYLRAQRQQDADLRVKILTDIAPSLVDLANRKGETDRADFLSHQLAAYL